MGTSKAETEALDAIKAIQDPLYYAKHVLHQDLWSLSPQQHQCSRTCFRNHKHPIAPDGSYYAGQDDVIRSAYFNRETAVKSCHGSGKTRVAAILVLGWLSLFPPGSALVITTSASWGQVEGELWGDVHKMLAAGTAWSYPKPNQFELTMPGGSRAFGMSTDEAVNFHGYHAENVLVIVDEVSGIKGDIMTAIDSIKSGGNTHILYLMNPVEASGPSVDLFEKLHIQKYTIDGLLTPNMKGFHIYDDLELNEADPDKTHNLLYLPEDPPDECELDEDIRKYLIRRRYVREKYEDGLHTYGSLKPEAEWWPRVRGQFPKEQISQLIYRDWILKANSIQLPQSRDTYVGIDVAGPGKSETALCMRNGYQVITQRSWATPDPLEEIIAVIGEPNSAMWIYVDAVAIGYGLCNELIHKGYNVVFCNAKNRPQDTTRFYDAKAEWYWKLRELFQDEEIGCYPTIDPLCLNQLLSIRWDRQNLKGLVRIEPKEMAAKRGVASPDRAEAMMLCFAATPHTIQTGQVVYVKNDIVHGNAAIQLGGMATNLGAPAVQDMPRAMDNWLTVTGARKLATKGRRGFSENAVRALLTPQRTALYNSNGKLIGYRDNPIDPADRRHLTGLLEPAD